jgi:hypothetical protein
MSLMFFWTEGTADHEESRPHASQTSRGWGGTPESGATSCASSHHGTRAIWANHAHTTAAVGVAVAPLFPGPCWSWGGRYRRPCRGMMLETSQPIPVRIAQAAIRSGFSSHTGALAAGVLLPRNPDATVVFWS